MAEQKKRGRKPSVSTQLANKVKKEKQEAQTQFPSGTVHYCTCCGKTATKTTLNNLFYISYSPFHNHTGRVSICKECIVKNSTIKGELIVEMLVEVIRMMDKPFFNSILESSINQVLNERKEENSLIDRESVLKKYAESVIGYMIKNLSMPQYRGMTWLDGDQRFIPKNSEILNDLNEIEDFSATDLVYKWGEGYSETDYLFLENRYNSLTAMANVEFESDAMMIKQICIKELQIRETQRKKGDDTKLVKALQELMATANIRPTDIKNANSDLLNDSYGKWLSVIEEHEPAEYFEDKKLYDDYDGIKKYFTNWVLRPLKNLLKGTRDFNVEE